MDIRDRVMGDQPDSFLHRIAGIVPGYKGYVDRERRRDADRLLRTHLARQYSAQRDRLTRVQQQMARAHNLEQIAEVDRLAGTLQRFIDRLQTATYGYTGLFDPIRIDAAQLDQLYAFDMSLASGVDKLSAAIDALETSIPEGRHREERHEDPLARLSSVIDELNARLNERADLISTGRMLPESDYRAMLSDLERPSGPQDSDYPRGSTVPTGGYPGGQAGAPGSPASTGDMARVAGAAGAGAVGAGAVGAGAGGALPPYPTGEPASETGTPTIGLTNVAGAPSPPPGLSSLSEGNQGFAGQPTDVTMGRQGPGEMPVGGTAGSGIETASSPTAAPGAPGGDIVEGIEIAEGMERDAGAEEGSITPRIGDENQP